MSLIKNQMWETSFTTSKSYSNPYSDVTLSVTYTNGVTSFSSKGFWDGGTTFKIRASFPTAGNWSYTTTCSDTSDTGLHNKTGSITITDYTGTNPLYKNGLLKVNGRYLSHEDNTPFLWVGDTAWTAGFAASVANWQTYINNRVSKKYSVVQLSPAASWAGTTSADGVAAFTADNKWNPAFWQYLDTKVQYANDNGIVLLFVGVGDPRDDGMSEANGILFAKNFAARMFGYHVIYATSFDSDSSAYTRTDNVSAAIKTITTRHLITTHPGTGPWGTNNIYTTRYHSQSYMSFAGLQSGHQGGDLDKVYGAARTWSYYDYTTPTPTIPLINLEAFYDYTGYNGSSGAYQGRAQDARCAGYLSFMNGAKGYSYGAVGLWHWGMTPSGISGVTVTWQDGMGLASSTHMGYFKDFFVSMEWHKLVPLPNKITNQTTNEQTKMGFAVSSDSTFGAAFLPNNASIAVDMTVFSNSISAKWFNTTTGAWTNGETNVSNTGTHTFTAPSSGEWALSLIVYTVGNGAPAITTQPSSQSKTVGQTATFTVAASGTAPLFYQWLKNNVAIPGAVNATYTTPVLTINDNNSTFKCSVANSSGSAVSSSATLTVTESTYTITHTVGTGGTYANIAAVNAISSFPANSVVGFKAGQIFTDAILQCKAGVTYTTWGIGQATLGDANVAGNYATINIPAANVTIDNLKIYGPRNLRRNHPDEYRGCILVTKGNTTIKNCTIIGGYTDSGTWRDGVGIKVLYEGAVLNGNIITRNDISNFGHAINYTAPYSLDISYNTMHNLWRYPGYESNGGLAIYLDKPTDYAWQCDYTVKIHHNEIYDFEYAAVSGGHCGEVLVEYNDIHDNLDERIYQGGVGHGVVAKWTDDQGDPGDGPLGSIFRYNYVHDMKKWGVPGYTYSRPTYEDVLAGNQPTSFYHNMTITLTNPSQEDANTIPGAYQTPYYKDAGWYTINYQGAQPTANTIGGGGYGNTWIHNNIFENVHQTIISRGMMQNTLSSVLVNGNYVDQNPYRDDYSSYFINNTLLNCGNSWQINETGIFFQAFKNKAGCKIINNIIDCKNTFTYAAIRLETYGNNSLGTSHNIYIGKTGTDTNPSYNSGKATWYRYNAINALGFSNEKYNITPGWIDSSSIIFAPNIGPNGTNIPNIVLQSGGNANNTGMTYNSIGDSYTVSDVTHQLGKDPQQAKSGIGSFAQDILGNVRTTNDIGALGTSNSPSETHVAPAITVHPQNQSTIVGGSVTFSVTATCNDPIGYQWWKNPYVSDLESKIVNGTKYQGANTNQLTVSNLQLSDDTDTNGITYVCEAYNTLNPTNLWTNSSPASINVIESGGRVVDGGLVLYNFNETSGQIVNDALATPINLTITGTVKQ